MDGRRFTYGDTFALSGRLANALGARGVGAGDRVVAQVEKTPEAVVLYLACLRAGAVYLPLNTAYTPPRWPISSATPSRQLIVCAPAVRDAAAASPRGAAVVTLDAEGEGTLADIAAGAPTLSPRVARRRRPRGAPLHLRHHRALQGRDADPRQPRVERAGAGRRLALRRATTC